MNRNTVTRKEIDRLQGRVHALTVMLQMICERVLDEDLRAEILRQVKAPSERRFSLPERRKAAHKTIEALLREPSPLPPDLQGDAAADPR